MTTNTMRVLDDRRNAARRRRVLKDGERIRVDLLLMDADDVQRAVATAQVTDVNGQPAGHRPGFLFSQSSTAVSDAEVAFDAEGERLRNAWRTPAPWVTDSKPAEQRRERQPDPPARPQRTNDAEAAYEALRAKERDAWRHVR
ncbi:MAG: hypothetical protein AB7O60_03655 [Variibacter sp.]